MKQAVALPDVDEKSGVNQLSRNQVLAVMKKVANWQAVNPSEHSSNGWEQAAYYTGVMALYDVSKDKKYLDAMVTMGQYNQWMPGKATYHADYYAVCQTYIELYLLRKKPEMIAPTRERLDYILANPKQQSLKSGTNDWSTRWSWCDALFMAPPVWARFYAVTGDKRYLDFMDKEWWVTTDYLYDPAEKLFYRDSRFFDRKSANGKKVFWSRGNGWVYAGLARVLQYMPKDYPSRPKYIKLFQEMTESIVQSQQPDGLWYPSLLDPKEYPFGETSGTGFFVYGLAWGINNGILDAAKYSPVVSRGWNAMVGKVHPDGKLGAVQAIGDRPVPATDESTEVYGTGAFLLAGSEVYKLLTQRPNAIAGGKSPLLSQTPDRQSSSSVSASDPNGDARSAACWARFVPERMDDFAWENDLVAFRAYGPAIKSSGGTEDSGIDCWLKRVKYPIIDKWYEGEKKGISYHQDHGEGNDPYHVGSSRGCGGLSIWKDNGMITSGPYKTWKIISRKPDESVFELTYDYNVADKTIHEVKRVTLELGKRLFKAESTFTQNGRPVVLDIAIGVTTHNNKAKATLNPESGWLACWENIEGYGVGTGVAALPSQVSEMREVKSSKPDESHALLLTRTDTAGKVVYYAGYGWEKAGEITTPEKWQAYLEQFAKTLAR